jgi:hypothetical protein
MTERLLAAEIRRFGGAAIRSIAKVELDLKGVVEFEPRGKRTAGLAAKTLEGTHRAVGKQRFGLGYLELAPATIFQRPKSQDWHWNFLYLPSIAIWNISKLRWSHNRRNRC